MEKHFDHYENGLVEHDEDYAATGIGEIAIIESSAPADAENIREPIEQEYDPLKAYLKSISLIPLLEQRRRSSDSQADRNMQIQNIQRNFHHPFFPSQAG